MREAGRQGLGRRKVGYEEMVTIAVRATTESRGTAGDHPPKSTVHMPAGDRVGRCIGRVRGPRDQALRDTEGLPL